MKMFRKMVAIEPTKLLPQWDEKLKTYAEETVFYADIPGSNAEIISRISDADCVLVSYTSSIDRGVLAACPAIRYIGMCCSLYSPESANVDILYAASRDITVTGVRDYGDQGVGEYVISELVRLLQGRGDFMWKEEAMELTGLNVGVIGMGTVGSLVTRTLRFFGANLFYYSRSRKPDIEAECDCTYLALDALLPKVDILITCLNKNVVLLGGREFELFGNGKILMNVSISPSHEIPALQHWLENSSNYALSDTVAGLGKEISSMKNAICGNRNAGLTLLAKQRLAGKVIANIQTFLSQNS